MYIINKTNNNFIIKKDNFPLFGGANVNYFIRKTDIFSLSIISLINPKDKFDLNISDMGFSNITDLFSYVVENVFGSKISNEINSLNSINNIQIKSIDDIFLMSKHNIPFYCGPRNSVIIRTDSKKSYMYDRYTLELIQVLQVTDTGNTDVNELYEDIVINGAEAIDTKGLNYLGTWNANLNIPNIHESTPENGDYYKVNTQGNTNINNITDWLPSDWIIYNGSEWEKIDQTEQVSSVNGEIGNVVLTTDDIDDSSSVNKYLKPLDITKLLGIEDNATADQTDLEIKTAYENNADTNNFSNSDKNKLLGIEDNAEVNNMLDSNAVSLVSGLESVLHRHDFNKLLNIPFIPVNISDLLGTLDDINNGLTYVKTTNDYTDPEKVKLFNIEDNATADQTDMEIKALYESNVDTNVFTDMEKAKLLGINEGAEVNHNSSEIKSLYENNADTNNFSDMEKAKLLGIEDNATADQTDMEIKSLYENNADTNNFSDMEKAKLLNIEDNATADQTGNEIKSLYESNIDTNVFTDAEKSKLSSLEGSKFLGLYTDLISLKAAHPSPLIGSHAHVDSGIGVDTKIYIWDSTDVDYVEQIGNIASETSESIKTKYESNIDTNAYTDIEKNKLLGIEDNATGDQTGNEIKSLYEAESDTNNFSDMEKVKLLGIQEGAEVNKTDNEIKASYENNVDTNAFTDMEKAKLLGIEDNATGDQTGNEIKSLYENNTDTNAFTDMEKAKLLGIEDNATGDQTGNEIKSLYESNINTNVFTDVEKNKLLGIEDGAVSAGGHIEFNDVIETLKTFNSDGLIISNNNTFSLISIEEFFNNVPRIISIPNNLEIFNGDKFEYQLDTTGTNLLYSLVNFPTGMTISAGGLIEYNSVTGNYINIEIIVENSYGKARQNIDLTVTGPKIGSIIKHSSILDLLTGESYKSKGTWANHNNKKTLKNTNKTTRPGLLENSLNTKDTLYFDGDDDHILDDNDYDKNVGSVIILFKPEMELNDYGQIFGRYTEGINIALNTFGGTYTFSFGGNKGYKAKYTLDGTNYSAFNSNGTEFEFTNNVWNKIYVEYETVRNLEEITVGSLYPDYSLGSYQYKGEIAIMAIYNDKLTTTQVDESFNWINDEYGI